MQMRVRETNMRRNIKRVASKKCASKEQDGRNNLIISYFEERKTEKFFSFIFSRLDDFLVKNKKKKGGIRRHPREIFTTTAHACASRATNWT